MPLEDVETPQAGQVRYSLFFCTNPRQVLDLFPYRIYKKYPGNPNEDGFLTINSMVGKKNEKRPKAFLPE